MSIICVIPARKGSKRLPGKNMKIFKGKPLIQWSIEQALRIFKPEQIVVNSDWDECLDLAKKLGVRAYERANRLVGDDITTIDVLKDMKIKEDIIVLLQPTSPNRSTGLIKHVLSYVNRYKGNICTATDQMNNGLVFIFRKNKLDEPIEYQIGTEPTGDIDTLEDFEIAEAIHVFDTK